MHNIKAMVKDLDKFPRQTLYRLLQQIGYVAFNMPDYSNMCINIHSTFYKYNNFFCYKQWAKTKANHYKKHEP